MLIKKKSDIEKYTADRYRIAKEVAVAVFEFLSSLEQEQVKR